MSDWVKDDPVGQGGTSQQCRLWLQSRPTNSIRFLLGRGGASFPKGIIDNPARLLLRYGPNSYCSGARPTEDMAVRAIAVSYALVAVTLLWSAAATQTDPDQLPRASGSSTQSTGQPAGSAWEAPIGHRQPRAKDVSSWIQDNYGVRSPEDEAIDRKLRICRDC